MTPTEAPLHHLSASEAAGLIAAGRITSEELTEACLAQIARREPSVLAWSAIDPERARAEARRCDRAAARGPLHGIPFAVKDVLDTADLPTEMGSPIYHGNRPRADASCVALLRAAGAVMLGKTVTAEFAGMCPGPTRNPHDLARTPGGSSSGSAAAVADFMVPLALGTQTGGSILRPASFCGIVGFKPSYGRINRAGLKFAAESLDTIGLIARSIDDIALFAAILSRRPHDDRDRIKPARIGLCRTHLWDTAQPETTRAIEQARDMLAKQVEIVEISWPAQFSALSKAREVINDVERSSGLAWEWANFRDLISPQLTRAIERGLATAPDAYREALETAHLCRAHLPSVFDGADILLAPCVPGEAPAGLDYAGDPALQGIWTALHVPTITLPTARGPNGLPVGIQLVAPYEADERLLGIARWISALLAA